MAGPIITEDKILNSVVARATGTVMYHLGTKERATQDLLHYQPVFQHVTIATHLRVVVSQN